MANRPDPSRRNVAKAAFSRHSIWILGRFALPIFVRSPLSNFFYKYLHFWTQMGSVIRQCWHLLCWSLDILLLVTYMLSLDTRRLTLDHMLLDSLLAYHLIISFMETWQYYHVIILPSCTLVLYMHVLLVTTVLLLHVPHVMILLLFPIN